jgi:plasmid stabilization system protein ParE
MAQVKWNKRASRQFADLQEYLLKEFGENTVRKFTTNVIKFLGLLVKHPHLGTIENKENEIRGFVLHRHTTILYKAQQSSIFVLSIFDNRQNPAKKK